MAAFTIERIGEDQILKNKYGIYSKKELITQLQEGHFTIDELGDIYKLKIYQMVHILRLLNIDFRNNVNDARILNPTISSSMHQVLLGTLLGDAFMTHPKYYQLGHGPSQFDYIYHVAERLHPFIATIGDRDTECATEKSLVFWTYRHSVFLDYFKRFYSMGKEKKFITKGSAYDLEDEGLAYWYMDDGKQANNLNFSVGNMSVAEIEILIELLRNKFYLNCNHYFHNVVKAYRSIYIEASSKDHFLKIISPYIIPSMRYKIENKPFPQIKFDPIKIISRHHGLCNIANRAIRYRDRKSVV